MAKVQLLIDPETAAAANAAVSGKLLPPENAVVKGKTKKWMQTLEISAATGEYKDEPFTAGDPKDPRFSFTIKFIVPPDVDAADPNNGRPFTQWYDVRPDAFHNPSHPRYKANNFTIGRLNALLRATGFEIASGEVVDYGEYFSADEGEKSMVDSLRVIALVREYEDKNGEMRQTIDDFLPVE